MTCDLPYTPELLATAESCVGEYSRQTGHVLDFALLAVLLHKGGVTLTDRNRGRSMVDERVYESALNRTHQAEATADGLLFKLYAVERLRRAVAAWTTAEAEQGRTVTSDQAPLWQTCLDAQADLQEALDRADLPPAPILKIEEAA